MLFRSIEKYERRNLDLEFDAPISFATSGTHWLRDWDVYIPVGHETGGSPEEPF